MVEFDISPYQGALPITFWMTPSDVERLLGQAKCVDRNFLAERNEDRDDLSIRYSDSDGKVAEIAFLPHAVVRLHGHSLFDEPDLVSLLLSLDPKPLESHGFLIFLTLGLTIAGFHDNDPSQRSITVFRHGRWDEVLKRATPWSPSSET